MNLCLGAFVVVDGGEEGHVHRFLGGDSFLLTPVGGGVHQQRSLRKIVYVDNDRVKSN